MTDLEPILDDVARAGDVVAPSWPLSSTIAVNPIAGFEDRPFADAIAAAAALFGGRGLLSLAELRAAHREGRVTDEHLAEALDRALPDLDERQRSILLVDLVQGADEPAPSRVRRTVAESHDMTWGTRWSTVLLGSLTDRLARGDLPPGRIDEPIGDDEVSELCASLLAALDRLGVPADARRDYLERHVSALPGWASHLRWRERAGQSHLLLRLLSTAVSAEADLVAGRARFGDVGDPPRREGLPSDRVECVVTALAPAEDAESVARTLSLLPGPSRAMVWQDAYERAVHEPILAAVAPPTTVECPTRPVAQVVCCIDVRSEPLRRHLEAMGGYETYGYAGFFGLAARVEVDGGGEGSDQCPVLISTTSSISVPAAPSSRRLGAGAEDGWDAAKHHPIAPLALAEGAGWLAGPLAAVRTALPGRRLGGRRDPWTVASGPPDVSGVPMEARADVVAALLGLGIEANPAPIIVLCGHTSHAVNNPTESGLTCGACGGHGGGINARAVAAMANDPAVRAVLHRRGRTIPEDTWFVGAEHDTASDRVTLLDDVPASHDSLLRDVRAALDAAGAAVAAERGRRLPGVSGSSRRTRRRALDWAEPVPELGLAGNAAFVVGPRSMTEGADLAGRVFLHSYEPAGDPDGTVLAGILTAPVVVAQWINAQYHFSTTDPEVYGAGSKAVHNVLGDIGVLSGPGGDLRRGLARQSVRAGDRLLHEPVRLLVAVEGHQHHVDAAIAGSPTLQQLVENEWVHLVARKPGMSSWWQRTSAGWSCRNVGERPERRSEVAA